MSYVEITHPDPVNNNKGCDDQGSSAHLFELTGKNANELKCRLECAENDKCEAVSGKWNDKCIGCNAELNVDDQDAIAFKKGISYFEKWFIGFVF